MSTAVSAPPSLLRDQVKRIAARGAQAMSRQASYDRAILVLSHMRAMTTALSNVLCTRDDVSGYGETHVPHTAGHALGQVIVNQALRRAWKLGATHLLDKLLHDHLDAAPGPGFYRAHAIFIVRSPRPAVASIVKLAAQGGMQRFASPEAAATYYARRLEALAGHWSRFPAAGRIGVTAESLVSRPDEELARIGAWLRLDPPLENRYVSHAASRHGGGGDPTASGRHTRIEPRSEAQDAGPVDGVDGQLSRRCLDAHAALIRHFEAG